MCESFPHWFFKELFSQIIKILLVAFNLDLSLTICLECGVCPNFLYLVSYLLVGNGLKTLFLLDCRAELRQSQEKSLMNVHSSVIFHYEVRMI